VDVGGLEAKVRQMYRQVAEQPQASYYTPNRQRSRASMIIINRGTARRTGRDRMIMEAPSKQVKAMRNITLIMLRMHPTPQEARATAGTTPGLSMDAMVRDRPDRLPVAAPLPIPI
jgi:hypothetical protein